MATSVVMPALEMAQETGRIISWLKKEGDAVAKGEALLEIETDKATVEIEAPADGILASVTGREGDVIPVGITIAWIVVPGEDAPSESARPKAPSARRMEHASAGASPKVSPKARRLAQERGVDL